MRNIVLLVGAMMATVVLSMAGPVSKKALSPRPVEAQTSSQDVIVENGRGADNARIQRAINDARGKLITIRLEPGQPATPETPSTCYTISGPIDLASNVTIDSKDGLNRWCMERATPPATTKATELSWFRVAGNAVDNFTLRNADLYGRGPGDVSQRNAFVDFGLVFNQRISDPQDPSLYSKNLTLEHVTFDHFYGDCVFTKYVNGIMFDDVVCDDPTKDGLAFTYGTRNGIIRNSVATLAGDDAMAFTSGAPAPGGARVTNITVENATLSQEVDALGCGSLCIRGATEIVATNSSFGSGGAPGSVGIRDSTDEARQWSSSNIEVSESTISPDSDQSGVTVNDPLQANPANIRITDNSIYYTRPQCGIRLTTRVPRDKVSQVTTSPNTFVPDDAHYNVLHEVAENRPWCGQEVVDGAE